MQEKKVREQVCMCRSERKRASELPGTKKNNTQHCTRASKLDFYRKTG